MTSHPLLRVNAAQQKGKPIGVCSICSANRFVLEAAMKQALKDESLCLIEATSNQVDQFGGYTGMTPVQFRAFVESIANDLKLPKDCLVLGGDHLGPNTWRSEPARDAMNKAKTLVTDYVRAGFTKIHLDASMHCAGDPGDRNAPLENEIVAERAAALCTTAESAVRAAGLPYQPVYIIGTEVPIPGGAQEQLSDVLATSPADAEATIQVTRRAFQKAGLQDAWNRVMAVVVQPGVEFSDERVIAYAREKAAALSALIEKHSPLIYEAHSTDYQTRHALRMMVEDHFAVLKVGPAVTFAFREAVFALAMMEDELLAANQTVQRSGIIEMLERTMLAHPGHWRKHYHGNESQRRYARKYSYSDRSRYYWPYPDVNASLERLFRNLEQVSIPLTLLSQFMPAQYWAVREGRIPATPRALVHAKIMEVTADYAYACGLTPGIPQ